MESKDSRDVCDWLWEHIGVIGGAHWVSSLGLMPGLQINQEGIGVTLAHAYPDKQMRCHPVNSGPRRSTEAVVLLLHTPAAPCADMELQGPVPVRTVGPALAAHGIPHSVKFLQADPVAQVDVTHCC